MSQDTRKDKRAKVVSLNVRYKSATVDEFIENHSHDVSKGGIFVKTPTPFPPGTLLKFEIRLAGDKSVIAGVGRVVWKREPTQAGNERPAGMGVKFIKIDDQSRALIDKLTTEKPQAGSAYTSEAGTEDEPAPVGHPSTLRGLVAAAPVAPPADAVGAAPPVSAPPAKPSGDPLPVPPVGKLPPPAKPPVMGAPPPPSSAKAVGGASGAASAKPSVVSAPAGTSTLKGPPPPAVTARASAQSDKTIEKAPVVQPPSEGSPGSPAPPPTSSEGAKGSLPPRPQIPPPRKATMMGIGLPGASSPPGPGGSEAPPKEPTPAPPKAAEPMFPRLDPESAPGEVHEPTVMKQAAELLEEALKEAGGSLDEIGQNPLFAKPGGLTSGLTPEPGPVPSSEGMRGQSGNTVVMGATPAPPGISPSAPPPSVSPSTPPPGLASTRGSSPSYDGAISQSAPHSMPGSQPLSAALHPPEKKGGSAGLVIGLVAVVLLAGGGVFAWQKGLIPGHGTAPTAAPPPANTMPTSTPSMSATTPPASTGAMMDAGPSMGLDSGAATAVDAGAAMEKDAGKAVTEKPDKPKPRPWRPPPKPPTTSSSGDTPTDTPTDTTPKPPAPTDVPKEAPPKDPTPAPDPN